MADSWLTDGNCKECRRQKYCNKPCKAHKTSTMNFIHGAVASTMLRTMAGLPMSQHTAEAVADVIVDETKKFGHTVRR